MAVVGVVVAATVPLLRLSLDGSFLSKMCEVGVGGRRFRPREDARAVAYVAFSTACS